MSAASDTPFSYEVIRSDRKTADIVIERDGRIVIRAPRFTSDDQIAKIVHAKERWIHRQLAERRDLNATMVLREYTSGEGFLYLGRSYRLSFTNTQDAALQLINGSFLMRRDIVDRGGREAAQSAFTEFYVTKGRSRLPERVAYFAPKVGVHPTSIDVRDLGNKWASCTTAGRLAFHWKCMMAPLTIIDYIIVHELSHLLHRDHTDAFWNEVDKVLPEYHERKDWLRRHGAGLDV